QLKLVERPFSLVEAKDAQEAFITSATSFVTPVVKIDGQVVGDGKIYVGTESGKFWILRPHQDKCDVLSEVELPKWVVRSLPFQRTTEPE
ncbi:MAG: hypothetical protein V4543_16000, partial [Bacteroidota bacterium]